MAGQARRSVTAIELWQANRSAAVTLPGGGTDMSTYVLDLKLVERLSTYGRQPGPVGTLAMDASAPVAVAAPAVLTHRRIVRIKYSDNTFEEYRIIEFKRPVSADGSAQLRLLPLWQDLQAVITRQLISAADPVVDIEWTLVGVSPATALAGILARGAPSYFTAGTVASTLAGASVSLHSIGGTPYNMLLALCEAVADKTGRACEWDIRVAGAGYAIDLSERIGGVINHPVEGLADGSQWNRRTMASHADASKLFTRVVPLGGPDGETISIADASWRVTGHNFVAAGEVEVFLDGDPIYVDDAPSGTGLRLINVANTTRYRTVTGTRPRNVVTIDTNGLRGATNRFPVGSRVRFGFADRPLAYIADAAAERVAGVKEELVRRSDIPPFANILVDAGVSTDLSSWASGLPVGVSRSAPAVTVTQTTDARYVKTGTSSMQVECDADGWVQTAELDLSGGGYTSCWVNMRVISGSIRLAIIDVDSGAVFPSDLEAYGVAEQEFRGLSLGGLAPPDLADAEYRLRITAREADTEFIIDNWNVTRSSGPYEYAPDMGPVALWNAASTLLAREGGIQPSRLEGSWIDLSQAEIEGGTYAAARIGASVAVKDAGINASIRLVELHRTLTAGNEILRGKLGSRGPDFDDFLGPYGRRGVGRKVTEGPPTTVDLPTEYWVRHNGVKRYTVAAFGGATGNTDVYELGGVVVTEGATLVWKRWDEAWRVAAVKTAGNIDTDRIFISSLASGFLFSDWVPGRGYPAMILSLAARTGAGTTGDPYVYHDIQSFTFSAETQPLRNEIRRVTAAPTTGGGYPEGTLLCLPVANE